MAVRWFERFVFRQATGIRSAGEKVEAVEEVVVGTVRVFRPETARLDSGNRHAAFEEFKRIAGGREIVVQQTAGDELRVVADEREKVVHAAAEIRGGLFETDEVGRAAASSVQIVFEQVVGFAEPDQKDVHLPPRKAVAARERRAPGGHSAVRRGSESRDCLREPGNGGADARADLGLRAGPEIVEKGAGFGAEVDLERPVPDGVPGRFGRAFERVAVPPELVRTDRLAQRFEVRLQVASGREDADSAEQVAAAAHGGRAVLEQVVQEAERVLRLELERGVDGMQGGFRFHVVEFSFLGVLCFRVVPADAPPQPLIAISMPTGKRAGNESFPARCYINC